MTATRRSAFTLLELLLVLFIIGLVAALSLPVVVANWSDMRMQGAAERLMASCRRARSEAVNGVAVHRLVFDTEAGTWWITREAAPLDAPGIFVRIQESWGRTLALPDGIAFQAIDVDVTEGEPPEDETGDRIIEFYRDGRTSGGLFTLTRVNEPDEEPVLIDLDPSTGRVQVVTNDQRDALVRLREELERQGRE